MEESPLAVALWLLKVIGAIVASWALVGLGLWLLARAFWG